jgi:oligoribonuclease
MFLAKQMPELDGYLHYRNVDVSTLKELARRWYPRVYFQAPEKHGGHRAAADILESIRELRYYRAALIVADPGPDSDSLKVLSQRIVDEFAPLLES